MIKILDYGLKPDIADNLPQMPALHDYKVDKIEIENNVLIISSTDFTHDYDYSDYTGFSPKKVLIEFIFENEVECSITVSRYFPKKQIREKNKYGHGKKSNCYDILEFIHIYTKYNLEILYNMVSYNQVNIIFAASNKDRIKEVEMQLFCTRVKYTFTN